jgi:hypothetical protein
MFHIPYNVFVTVVTAVLCVAVLALAAALLSLRSYSQLTAVSHDCSERAQEALQDPRAVCAVGDVDTLFPGDMHVWLLDSKANRYSYTINGFTGTFVYGETIPKQPTENSMHPSSVSY